MGKKLFNWNDIARIGESVFYDEPETEKQIKNWTKSLFYICVTVKNILRQVEPHLEKNQALADGVYDSIIQSVEELTKAADLFPRKKLEKLVAYFYEEIVSSTVGYAKVLPEKE